MFSSLSNLNSREEDKKESNTSNQQPGALPSPAEIIASAAERMGGLTFSGLLNALDGLAVSKNRIIFMTTNHIEKLDKALIRPGRCDKRIYIGNPSKETIRRLYQQFFPRDSRAQQNAFVEQFKDSEHSTSYIQEKLLVIRNEIREELLTDQEAEIFS